MATKAAPPCTTDSEDCIVCKNQFGRIRSSFCLCKHCSVPLCMACIKEHHDEVLQEIGQISHRYNELKELLQKKQKIIIDEASKSIEDVNDYFQTYINELFSTQQKIILDIKRVQHDAQNYLSKLDSDLCTIGHNIQVIAKENVADTTKMKNLSMELASMEDSISTYQSMRTENLPKIQPEFSIKFECSSLASGNIIDTLPSGTMKVVEKESRKSSADINKFNKSQQSTEQQKSVDEFQEFHNLQDNDSDWESINNDDNDDVPQYYCIQTSYPIGRMASDGENIMYTSYYNEEPDLIAYSILNGEDQYRDWKQSRIVDMIWWKSIEKFLCATNSGLYTVTYGNGKFKIQLVLNGKWSYCRVAANTLELFVWINCPNSDFDGIEIYSTEFEHLSTIDFNRPGIRSFVDSSSSFCMTDNLVASICMRKQNNRDVFRVTFCDIQMNELKSIPLGKCSKEVEIRTDGNDRFFITTGQRRLYIIDFDGNKTTINLQHDGDCITVLADRRVAISKERDTIDLLTY